MSKSYSWESLQPAGYFSFRLFKQHQPLQGIVVCSDDKLTNKQIELK